MDLGTTLARGASWQAMRDAFRWPRLRSFNIAEMICERWARHQPDRLALTYLRPDEQLRHYSYAELSRAANRLANALAAHGLGRGDRMAVLLPQTPEAVLTHIACYKLGAIVVPMSILFGPDSLRYRLAHSGARMVVADGANLDKVLALRDDLPGLERIFSIDARPAGTRGFWQELGKAADRCPTAATGPDDPALLCYTSGTTGPPKGALHGHRVLLGHLPGFQTHHDFAPQPGDCIWTPADWAWLGGLANVMLPALALGMPLVAHRMARFDPDRAFDLIARMGVCNAFLPPTALKLMRQAGGQVQLRSVGSGGEALGAGLLDWGRQALGATINEFYGQTEANLVLGNCAAVFAPRPGSTGRAVPGCDVAILGPDGRRLPPGTPGEIAIRRGARQMFLGYWNDPERTAARFVGPWMRTGDVAQMDADGHVYFAARADDVITSSGYRIGPTEIEDCLTSDPAVTMAAVVGVPDALRTESIRAYVVPCRPGSADLARALIERVRTRIGPHAAPRDVVFVDALPLTTSGKIIRKDLRDAAHVRA